MKGIWRQEQEQTADDHIASRQEAGIRPCVRLPHFVPSGTPTRRTTPPASRVGLMASVTLIQTVSPDVLRDLFFFNGGSKSHQADSQD